MAIGSLAVRVSADTAKFASGMNKTRKPTQNLRTQMKQVGKRAAKMSAAMAAAGAAIATHLTNRGLEAVDAQAKLGRQLGTTQAVMAGMERAAQDAGISQEQLGKNLQALDKRLGEAQQGTGQARDALDQLGLSADQLASMPVDERLGLIQERMRGLEGSTQRAAVAADLFSRSGQDMANMADVGATSIREATKEAQQFGTAVTQVDAAQIESANDAMSRISTAIQGVSNQLAVQMAPLLEGVADLFVDASKETGGFREEIASAVETSVRVVAFLADAVEGVRRAFVLAGQGAAVMALDLREDMVEAAEAIMSGPVDAINELIRLANHVPGVDIGEFEQPDLVTGMQQELELARGAVREGKKAMHETLMEPFPGTAMREWAADVKAQSNQAAEAVVQDRENERQRSVAIRQIMARQFGEINIKEMEQETAINQQKLARLREFLGKRAEAEIADHERKMERLREMLNLELITQQEFQERERQAKKEHEKALTDMAIRERKRETDAVGRFAQANQAIRENSVASEAAALRSGLQTMFGDQKAASLAIGALKRFEAVTSAYAWGSSIGGPPMGAAAAATAAVAQASTLSDMGSTSMGGGVSTGGSTQPAAGSTSAPAQGGSSGGGASSPITMINLQGDSFGRDQVRDLLERINEENRDGGRLEIN